MVTTEQMGAIWRLLRATYPTFFKDRPADEVLDTLSVYEQLLSDLPFEALQAATVQHVTSSRWFPTIAELRESAGLLMLPPVEPAMIAWGKVVATMRMSGTSPYRTPAFDNPITAKVIDALGWYDLCSSENEVADRAHFCQAYDAYAKRQRDDGLMLPQVAAVRGQLEAGRKAHELFSGVAARLTAGSKSDG